MFYSLACFLHAKRLPGLLSLQPVIDAGIGRGYRVGDGKLSIAGERIGGDKSPLAQRQRNIGGSQYVVRAAARAVGAAENQASSAKFRLVDNRRWYRIR